MYEFHNYSYEIVALTVIVNSYKTFTNCYQIVKITVYYQKLAFLEYTNKS